MEALAQTRFLNTCDEQVIFQAVKYKQEREKFMVAKKSLYHVNITFPSCIQELPR